MSNAIDVSAASWDSVVTTSDVPVVVDFWAPWCGPCRMIAPEIDKLAARAGSAVKFVKLNIDDNQSIAVEHGVMSIPTVIKFENGKAVSRVTGARGADSLAKELGLGV